MADPYAWDPSMGGAPPAYPPGAAQSYADIPPDGDGSGGGMPGAPQTPADVGAASGMVTLPVNEETGEPEVPWFAQVQNLPEPKAPEQLAPQQVARRGGGGGMPRLPDIKFQNREKFAKQSERLEVQHLRAKEAIREQMRNGTIPMEEGNKQLLQMDGDYQQRKLALDAEMAGYNASLEGRIEEQQYTGQAIQENAADTEVARAQQAAAAGQEQAQLLERQGEQLQGVNQQFDQRMDTAQQAADDAIGKYETAVADLAASKVDPDRMWKRKGTGLKVMAIIGASIGAFASSLSKTPNAAAQMISDAIDRDIRSQEMELGQKRAAVSAQGNIVGMMRNRLGDVSQARVAAKAAVMEQIGSKLEAKKATARSADELARIEGLQKEIGLKRDEFKQEMGVKAKQLQLLKEQERRKQLQMAMAARQPKGPEWKAQKGWDARFVPGAGVAPDAASAKELREKVAANREVLGILKEMRALTAQSGKSWDPAARAKAAALESRMLTATNKSEGLGALDNGTLDVLKPRIPKLSSMTQLDSQTNAALDTVEALVKQGQRIKFQSEGVLPTARRPGAKGWEYAVLPGAVEMPGRMGRPSTAGVQEGAVQ